MVKDAVLKVVFRLMAVPVAAPLPAAPVMVIVVLPAVMVNGVVLFPEPPLPPVMLKRPE